MLVLLFSSCNSGIPEFGLEECESTCLEKGFSRGECLWPEESRGGMLYIGSCDIDEGSNCYCSE